MPVPTRERKLYAGSRVGNLRKTLGLSQRALASAVGVSASYLNQIENDQRPLPPALMLSMCARYDVDATYFSDGVGTHKLQLLREILADPLFKSGLRPDELDALLRSAPSVADHFIELYRAFRNLREESSPATLNEPSRLPHGRPDALVSPPYEAVGEWVQAQRNYFDEIDRAAEHFYEIHRLHEVWPGSALEQYLLEHHNVRVITERALTDQGIVWRYDRRERRMLIGDGLPGESRNFCLAQLVGRLAFTRLLERPVRVSNLVSEEARALARVSISNYFAGALLLPYERFRQAARETRHDIDALQRRFQANFEQVCHRLSTLQRPGAEGIPFYFIKVDVAGNILKSFSATRFSQARFGGLCSLWNAFQCFATPGKLVVQLSQNTDDAVFIAVARTVGQQPTSYFDRGRHVSVVLGCSVNHASEIVYSAGLDLTDRRLYVPIGPGCRACTRSDCRHRALPGSGQTIATGSDERGIIPYQLGNLSKSQSRD